MKKIFTLFFALFIMAFCAKAQQTLLQEGFETSTLPTGWTIIDNDGDGFNWFPTLSTTQNYSCHSGDGCITSASWDETEQALTPDNWLITPAVTLTSNATLTFWVVGQDPSYAEENFSVYVATSNTVAAFTATTPVLTGTSTDTYTQQTVNLSAYTGQTVYIAFRHHNVTDMFMLNIDDVEVFAQPTSPTLTVEPTTIDFGTIILSDFESATATVTAFNLTTGITATTTAPFSVSADDITYSTTATIGQNGGTLYVKYTPTAAGNHNGTVTLSSTGATNVTITLTGSCVDCATNNITTFPYVYTFNDGIIPPLCWGYNDAAHFGVLTVDEEAGDYAAIIGVVDYLITPEITSTSPLNMSIDYLTYAGMNQLEGSSTFRIGYSTTNNNYSSFTWLTPVEAVEATGLFTTYSSIIPAGTKYIAIDVTEINTFYGGQYYNYLFFDNLTLSEINNAEIFASTDSVSFGIVQLNNEAIESISVVGALLTSDITATTAAPFSVSADGTTYGTTATFTQAGGTLYVKYAPTAAATNNGMVTLTSTGVTDVTITLTGTGLDCSNNPLPYSNDFTDEALNDCWTIVDANNDGSTFAFSTTSTPGLAYYTYNSNNAANDWLISPVFQLGASAVASFDYAVASATWPERFSVYVIAEGQTYANATQVVATQQVSNTSLETQYIDLTAYANHSIQIAIKCESEADKFRLYITNFFVGDNLPTTVTVNRTSINFGTIPAGTSMDAMFIISSTNLNEDINITTSAPYEISLDGNTYSATATIPANSALAVNDTVYVQFAPTAAGSFSNIVTISTTSTNDTIALTGASIECNTITTFPFTEDFEETSTTLSCWTINDANNDGNTFSFYEGTARYHYDSNNDADDWLISPEMTLTGSQIATFDYWAQSNYYAERFQVYAIATGSTPTPLTNAIDVTSTTAESQIIDLSNLTGNYRIAIKCISDADMYYLNIDNFVVSTIDVASLTVNPTSISFGNVTMGVPSNAVEIGVTGLALTSSINVTAPANFEVSTDNLTYGATATIANTGVATQASLYVRMNATTAGSHSGNITLTSGTATANLSVNGNAVDCSGNISTLPYTEDFEDGEIPSCWSVLSTNETTWTINEGSAYCNYSETPQDEKLITNTISFAGHNNITMTFDFKASYYYIHNEDPEEQYNLLIYASTDNGNTFSNTPVYDMRNDQGEFTNWEVTTATVDLSSLAGQSSVKLMFNYYGNYGAELYIDDINITGTTSIADVESNNVSVYPNPANNVINVNSTSNISNVEVYTITGQKVGDFTANSNSIAISTSNLTSGLYLMQIHTENGVINKKFTVAR